jgi:hypothetical protein
MKTFAAILSAASVLLGVASAQTPNTAALEKQLIANEQAISAAIMKKDVKAFHALVQTDGGGGIDMTGMLNLADYDQMIADMTLTSTNIQNPHVYWMNADVAVVAYTWTGKGTWKGMTVPSPTYASTTWVKQPNGKWLAKFHQETMPLPAKPTSTK